MTTCLATILFTWVLTNWLFKSPTCSIGIMLDWPVTNGSPIKSKLIDQDAIWWPLLANLITFTKSFLFLTITAEEPLYGFSIFEILFALGVSAMHIFRWCALYYGVWDPQQKRSPYILSQPSQPSQRSQERSMSCSFWISFDSGDSADSADSWLGWLPGSGFWRSAATPPPLLAQARKIAPFSQEDMNHTSKAELSKEMLRILSTSLLP